MICWRLVELRPPRRRLSETPVRDLVEAQFLIELEFLEGRKRLEPTPVTSFLKY